jgi:hypothetical protein
MRHELLPSGSPRHPARASGWVARMRRGTGPWAVVLACALAMGASIAHAEAPHLPFFQANRDWILRRFEALERPDTADLAPARAWSFDPFADESALARLRAAHAAFDSAQTVGDLGLFRATLDSLLASATSAGARLDSLDQRFAAHLRTALEVTLATLPALEVERVEAWLDGRLVQQHTLSATERASLAAGGVLEVARRVVEPRRQTLEVRAWTRGAAAPSRTTLVVEPDPDRLAVVHLDLQAADQPARTVHTTLGSSN